MKCKLRGSFTECVIMVLIFYLVLGGLFVIYMEGQEKDPPAKAEEMERVPVKMPPPYPPTKAQEAEEAKPIKTWRIPDYMRENLQRDLDDFNKRFEKKVQAYKKELKTRFKEFKDMPTDVIFYLEGGFFITRSGLQKLQEQLRDKLKQEVKGDDKTTN